MDLTDVDHTLIIKHKIDPLKIFSSNDYTHELSNYIQFLIKNGIDIDPKLLSDITDVKRYPSINSWPSLDSICIDILDQLLNKGIDIEDEKYSELRAGLHANESAALNFTFKMIRRNLDFPMYFDYVFDEPRQACYLFDTMIKSGYSKDIPDFIFENIFKDSWNIMDSITRILDNTEADADAFLKYIDIFTEKLISLHFIPIIDKTNTLKKLESFGYTNEFKSYIASLKKLFRTFNKSNSPDILLKLLKSTKFKKHIKKYFNFNPWDDRDNIDLIKRSLSKFNIEVNESYSFKEYFNRK